MGIWTSTHVTEPECGIGHRRCAFQGKSHGYKAVMSSWILRVSMEKAQEGVWLLVISLSYPRQALPDIDVQWPSRARDACAKTPVSRRDSPANPHSPDRSVSSTALVDLGRNNWRPLPSVYLAVFNPHYGPPILIIGMKTCRCSGHLSHDLSSFQVVNTDGYWRVDG